MPSLKDMLFGTKEKTKQVSTISKDQQDLLDLIKQGLTEGDGAFGDIFNFNPEEFEEGVTNPALKNFQENILPMISEKFIAGNQQLGSGQRRAENKAGTDLQSQLSQLMYKAQQDAKQNKIQGINTSLNKNTFENVTKQGTTGVLPGLVQGAVSSGLDIATGGASSAITAGASALKGIIAG